MNIRWLCLCGIVLLTGQVASAALATILAGGETGLPADTPSGRLDTAGEFAFVGALAISNGSANYRGSAVALSPEWVLTAGHNADLNDDGLPDALWSSTFMLPGYGSFGVAQVFRYDFDAPATTGLTGGSLGNEIETIIGPGDSGGAALRQTANGWELVGVNTFTEGYGGRFGDTGGGVLVHPYMDWIYQTSGIPEPGSAGIWVLAMAMVMLRRSRSAAAVPS